MLGVILSAALTLATFAGSGVAQVQSQGPSSWPHNYTGLPSEPYSPAWQSCASRSPSPGTPFDSNNLRLRGHAAASKRVVPALAQLGWKRWREPGWVPERHALLLGVGARERVAHRECRRALERAMGDLAERRVRGIVVFGTFADELVGQARRAWLGCSGRCAACQARCRS
jgi:hypothetical protein